ncbi:MAG: [Oscillospiraceae bacterium]|nr:[FeFe] hydrogenase H-cluster maturation GTPase HydF [Oscillospiraceae bacterium]MBQ7083545.1 [FeFe] hydrogenase H-cluster maturation GTPase HydF [Oscillospiraceae bacterium]MBR2635549.1 [FeFe] hydrogenase H-cluster maturation GTPase HydF [Oscillospiraceae bacterium]MBR6607309.1 [FeFe] hydrogenase H-cluster maturation GTPase HydF [Oscillospiraceae bacterium]
MSMNAAPSANRIHIGFFGMRNAGKSSVVNAVTGQELSIVSDTKGTTTDPVQKAMELLPMGPVLIIDTPGFDDEGQLGQLRVRKTRQVLNKTDVAVLVVDAAVGMTDLDRELLALIKEKNIPHLLVYNKSDLVAEEKAEDGAIFVSAATGKNIHELKERIAALGKSAEEEKRIVGDLIGENDLIVLVTPIDEAAPKGRIILPQQQTIRDILDSNAMCVVTKETQLTETLQSLGKKPRMVITDSQVFGKVSADTPADIPLTSFSILMARYKGFLESAVKGVAAIETLQEGDTILIAEGCTHHRQCNDIGSVKIPRWLRNHVGQNVNIELSSGADFPEDLSRYKVIIHCGGCMLPAREVMYRLKCAEDQGVPMTNYGIAIAYMQGILRRSVDIFPDLAKILDEIK